MRAKWRVLLLCGLALLFAGNFAFARKAAPLPRGSTIAPKTGVLIEVGRVVEIAVDANTQCFAWSTLADKDVLFEKPLEVAKSAELHLSLHRGVSPYQTWVEHHAVGDKALIGKDRVAGLHSLGHTYLLQFRQLLRLARAYRTSSPGAGSLAGNVQQIRVALYELLLPAGAGLVYLECTNPQPETEFPVTKQMRLPELSDVEKAFDIQLATPVGGTP